MRHSHDRAVQKHVLPPREFWIESGAQLQESGNPSVHGHRPRGGSKHGSDDLQQCRFTRPVAPQDPHDLAFWNIKTNTLQRPKLFVVTLAEWVKRFFYALHRRRKETIFLGEFTDGNGNFFSHRSSSTYNTSAKSGLSLLKTYAPRKKTGPVTAQKRTPSRQLIQTA